MARFKINIIDTGVLCSTCRSGQVMERAQGRSIVLCSNSHPLMRVPADITSCTDYDDKRTPSEYDYRAIAWEIKHDNSGRIKGFAPPKKRDIGDD
jgi:hypothetical protein